MKKIKLALLLILLGCIKTCFAQNDTIYFDKKWKECSKDSFVYFRVFGLENFKDMVTDYQRNGTLQMKARISQRVPMVVDGICMYYSETGKLESKGLYRLNKKLGIWIYYDQTGNDSSIVEHFLNEPKKEIKVTCDYMNYDSFIAVEVMPEFPGGENGFSEYIKKSILNHYSEIKDKSKLKTKSPVYVYFVINKSGKVMCVTIRRSGTEEMNEIAKKIIEEMPLWKPGMQNGLPVNVQLTYPIKFYW
jgi:antitoxin component YwqK of YwqJK toxin-antitoxin module